MSFDFKTRVEFIDIKDQIRPFDLLAFRGTDLISHLVLALEEEKTGCNGFSHVGMVVTKEILDSFVSDNGEIIYLEPGKIYVYESTITYNIPGTPADGIPDITSGKTAIGVQLRDFEEVMANYLKDSKAAIGWCKVKDNPYDNYENESEESLEARRKIISERFTKLFESYRGRNYETDVLGLVGSLFPGSRKIRNLRDKVVSSICEGLEKIGLFNNGAPDWQFCSEFVANIYIEFDILPENIDARNVLPVDFFGSDQDGMPVVVEPPIFLN